MKNQTFRSPSKASQVLMLMLFVLVMGCNTLAQNTGKQNGNYATINGAKIWYETNGAGEPLLLIPGGPGMSHVYFTPHFSKFADKFKVIYFDAFGRGKSERAKSPGEYTFQRDIDDIEGLRKHLKIDELNILGHSYGGIAAQAYVLKYPQRVNKLILSNTLFNSKMFQALIDNMNNEIQNQYPQVWEKLKIIRSGEKKSSSIEFFATSAPLAMGLTYFYDVSNMKKVAGDQFSFNPDVYFSMAGDDSGFVAGGELGKLDFSKKLKDVKAPTMIIAGRFDRGCYPKYTLEFKKHMPQAKFVMFEQSGHFPFIEEPQKFHETIISFLNK